MYGACTVVTAGLLLNDVWFVGVGVGAVSIHRGMPSSSTALEQKLCRKLQAARSHRDTCTDPTRRSKIASAVEALEARVQQLIEARESGTSEPVEPKRKAKHADLSRRPKRQRQANAGASAVGSLAAGAAVGDGRGMSLGERVARAALLAFDSLPSRGKPQPHEWTVLAAFVAVYPNEDDSSTGVSGGDSSTVGTTGDAHCGSNDSSEQVEVLAIGTGTKCVGVSRMSTFGDRLHDSHAEIIARRALRRYILAEYTALLRQDSESAKMQGVLLERRSGDHEIGYRPGVQLALYINQPPCGDASIFDTGAVLSVATENIGSMSSDVSNGVSGAASTDGAASAFIKQTGAKPVAATALGPQAVGVLRTKSGRSDLRAEDRSISMSCSDKIAKWNVLGVGGALLSILLPGEALYINHLVVGQPAQQPQGPLLTALRRAVVDRANEVVLEQQPVACAPDEDRLGKNGNGNLARAGYSTPAQRDACPGRTGVGLHVSSACVFTAARPDPSITESLGESTAGNQRKSSCGFSLAWHKTVGAGACNINNSSLSDQNGSPGELDWVEHAPGLCEVTIGATGLRQGAKLAGRSSGAGPAMQSMQSSLCKRQMLQNFEETLRIKTSCSFGSEDAVGARRRDNTDHTTVLTRATGLVSAEHADCPTWLSAYDSVKHCADAYQRASESFRAATPFREWLRGQPSQSTAKPLGSASECCP